MTALELYVLISPAIVLVIALGVMWLTGWMDRREERRRAQHRP